MNVPTQPAITEPDFYAEAPVNPLSYAHFAATPPSTPPMIPSASNKEDVLTQSQMLKAADSAQFIASQQSEIDGLTKFDVMDIDHISSLPPKA
jgi:hypothetical protein